MIAISLHSFDRGIERPCCGRHRRPAQQVAYAPRDQPSPNPDWITQTASLTPDRRKCNAGPDYASGLHAERTERTAPRRTEDTAPKIPHRTPSSIRSS